MLVVIIIGALTAMVMPRLAGRTEQAKIGAAKADINANISTALKLYELDTFWAGIGATRRNYR